MAWHVNMKSANGTEYECGSVQECAGLCVFEGEGLTMSE